MRKKVSLLACAAAVCMAAALSVAYALPSNCHYHSDGRVHCVYQVPQDTEEIQQTRM
jgi:hypothetical protein